MKALRLLMSLVLSLPENEVLLNSESIKLALSEFQGITDHLLREDDFSDEFELDKIESQFFVEWIYNQAWFLYLTESVESTVAFLDEILSKLGRYQEDRLITMLVCCRVLRRSLHFDTS